MPQGWTTCFTGDVSKVIGGGTPDAANLDNFSNDEGVPWLTPADLSGFNGMYVSRGKRFLTTNGFNGSSAKLMPKGAVLFSSRAPIGYVAVAANEISTNQGFKSFVCEESIVPEYLFFYLKFAKPLAEELASGTTFAEISGKNAALIPVVLPPLKEQHRIVTKLEEVLFKVDASQQRLAKIPVILKRFRQAVLAAACSGRLTADWREENSKAPSPGAPRHPLPKGEGKLSPADLLPLHEGEGRGEGEDLPEEWRFCSIADVGKVCNGSTPSRKCLEYWNGDIHWVSSGEVRNNIISTTRETISTEGYNKSSVRLLPAGTVLLAMIGEGKTRGQTAILRIEATINQNIAAVVINPELITSEYLWHWFQFQYEITRQSGSGSGPQALNCQRVRELSLNLPPLPEQQEIVRRVESFFTLADQLEAHYRTAKTHVDKLTQSILAKAFRGELVPQDLSNEPAAALLVRIRAEREATPTMSRKRSLPEKAVSVSSLKRQSKPSQSPPKAAPEEIELSKTARRILRHMKLRKEYSKDDILVPLVLSTGEWNVAIRELKGAGVVMQTGDKRGARYQKVLQ